MDKSELESGNFASNNERMDWDVDSIADQIFKKLNGSVARKTILDIIKEDIPNYEDARIQTYVPILIQRDVINILLSMDETFNSPAEGIEGVHLSKAP